MELVLAPVAGYSPDDRPNPRGVSATSKLILALPYFSAVHFLSFLGEILVRRKDGRQTRYWEDPEQTSQAWDSDGWYHTGDVGELSYREEEQPNTYAGIKPALGHCWTAKPIVCV